MASWIHTWRAGRLPTTALAIGLGLALLLVMALSLVVGDAWRERDQAVEALKAEAQRSTEAKARELSQLLTDVYVTTRTISLLPAVRHPAPQNRASTNDDVIDGKRFTATDAQTVLQLYHHLAQLLSVSEIYVVYDSFAPERGEVPFLMFDSVIVERIRRLTSNTSVKASLKEDAEDTEQDEREEYAELVGQLAQFRRDNATLPANAPQGIASLVSRPIVTCDNSQYLSARTGHERDRRGVLMSVPVYDADSGRFKGLVTTVVRLNVLEARLLDWPMVPVTEQEQARAHELGLERTAPAEYVLSESQSGVSVSDRRNDELQAILDGRASAGLTLGKTLEVPGQAPWRLTRHVPQAAFDQIHATANRKILTRSAIALSAVAALAALAWLLVSQRRTAARLKEMAEFDPLTGLPNRRQLDRRLESGLRLAHGGGLPLTVVMVDLDNFKTVNDTHGHHVGDLLLTEVARRFQKQINAGEAALGSAEGEDAEATEAVVGRLGGDEFLVLLPRLDSQAAVALTERLLAAMSVPMIVDGHSLHMRASLGVAMFPEHGRSASQLLRSADQAMYAAKRVDESAVVVFQREVDHAAVRRTRLTADLREALVRGQFELHYQTVVNVPRVRVDAAEALLRWQHPELGAVSPAEFVPLLERSGLIVPVGLWALRRACEQLLQWQSTGSPIGSVAVNVSVVQLASSDFSGDALDVIAASGIDPERLTIEVTESVLMENPERSIAQLRQLRDAGVRVAIDDFGAGYSSLGYLRRLPVQVMKIDRSLLIDAVSPTGRAILAAMVDLAEELGLDCVAEGVETLEQFELLLDVGCRRLQGYLFARPLPAEQADAAARRLDRHGGSFSDSFFAGLGRRSGFAELDG